MQTVRYPRDLAAITGPWRAAGERIALVPTMGALHAGHLTLVRLGKALAERVVVSIFVNPLQFGAGEDLDRYPRQEQQDLALLRDEGCDLAWLPGVDDLYPAGFATTVSVAGVSERWDGAARPGHFNGVATVVAKLLIAVAPDTAIFGEKDYQQLAVIRRMTRDLGLATAIVGAPIVRDPDGLALSSRNAYLSADERQRALALPRALLAARDAMLAGVAVTRALAEAIGTIAEAGFTPIDYVALVDAATLEPAFDLSGERRIAAAARMGKTRLIDNLRVISATPESPG